ncbi:hypothetical protein JDV02_006138 [Purpureocillium takamizusanense]|uniref:Wax synthase domain-containing protein n=1 Tax=Purpureocillium takamizusanense TaxID=2060973 RepID=A0A9Q8VCG1_9HYPO|nr:uncharacterized protein JDV02_006138 [Purpureocillium takamizusanense]UNI20001.1 hypothetical protein JDV02_006138 [Purpureocillium takamizusanense]
MADIVLSAAVSCLWIAQTVLSSLCIVFVPKQSYLRYVWIPCSLWIAYQAFRLVQRIPTSPIHYSKAGAHVFVVVAQAANLLVLNPLDRRDLLRAEVFIDSSPVLTQIWSTFGFLIALRGIGTHWQVKNVPAHPKALIRRAKGILPRKAYIIRQGAILTWQYLVLDFVYVHFLQDGSPKSSVHDFQYRGVDLAGWLRRAAAALVTWFLVARLLVDSIYRTATLIAVGLGGAAPDDCPPLFGSMWDAYTLRNFWGYVCYIAQFLFSSPKGDYTSIVLMSAHKSSLFILSSLILTIAYDS